METTVITIQIGNSDNRLTQVEWAEFIKGVRECIGRHCGEVHFDGGSRFDTRWQNACFVAELGHKDKPGLLASLTGVRKAYRQESIAISIGKSEFI